MDLSNYKKIIIHAGVHKTGSSYLQKILQNNRSSLSASSVHFPSYRGGNDHNGNHSLAVINGADAEDVMAKFSRELDLESCSETLLISAEEMSRLTISEKMITALQASVKKADFKVILYFRRFDHLLESVYAESVKNQLVGDIERASYQLDFRKTLAPFEKIFGRDSIIIRPYNKNQWNNNSLAKDFFDSLDLDINGFNFLTERLNTSLSRQETHILSMIPAGEDKAAARKILSRGRYRSKNTAKYFRSPERRRAFIRSHRHILSEIAENYNIGDVDDVFDLNNFQDDPGWTPYIPDWREISQFFAELSRETRPDISNQIASG